MKKILFNVFTLFLLIGQVNSQVVISEVSDPADDFNARFIELYNMGSVPFDFDAGNFWICRQVNGGATWSEVLLTGLVNPGETYVIANDSISFFSAYGFYPNSEISGGTGNGDDGCFFMSGGGHLTGTIVDAYGVIDVNGAGQPWEYTDAHAVRRFTITGPNDVWTASEWNIVSGNVVDMTPGSHQEPLPPYKLALVAVNSNMSPVINVPFTVEVQLLDSLSNPAIATGNIDLEVSIIDGTGTLSGVTTGQILVDANSTTISGVLYDVAESSVRLAVADIAGTVLSDTSIAFDVIDAPPVADIVISEIMYNPPESGTDSLEFIELFNNESVAVNLNGYYFSMGVTYTFPDTILEPGGYYLIAERATAMQALFGVVADEWVGSLTNGGETLVLTDNYNRTVDSVSYLSVAPWPLEAAGAGASIEFCDMGLDNAEGANWTASAAYVDTLAGGLSVFATPGIGCYLPTPAAFEIVTINNNLPVVVNQPFDMQISLVDEFGNSAVALADVNFSLQLLTGSGTFGGTITGTISTGSSTGLISGITYSIAETGVSFAVVDDNLMLESDTAIIDVVNTLPLPYEILITGVNNGFSPVVNTSFSIFGVLLDDQGVLVQAIDTVFIEAGLVNGTGILSGNINSFVAPGDSIITIAGLIYNTEETGVSIRLFETGMTLIADTTLQFDVVAQNNNLIISEVTDPADDFNGRFIELFNAGSTPVIFDSEIYFIARQINGGGTWQETQLSGQILPGDAFVIANDTALFAGIFGFDADLQIPGAGGNGDDAVFLFKGGDHATGVLIDAFGEPDLDGTGTLWEYLDARALRNFDITSPNTTWTQSEWTITAADNIDCTPGIHVAPLAPYKLSISNINNNNDVLVSYPFSLDVILQDSLGNTVQATNDINLSVSLHTGSGNLSGNLAGTLITGTNNTTIAGLAYDLAETGVSLVVSDDLGNILADTSIVFNVIEPAPLANIVITEIMYNSPESGTDTLEFIELYNRDMTSHNLAGYYFASGVTYTFPDTTIGSEEYFVLAVNSQAFNSFFGYNALEWTTGSLSNSGEAIILNDNYSRMVDSVFYATGGTFPTEANGLGSSLTLCDPSLDNSIGNSWSTSQTFVDTLNGVNVFATPGAGCTFFVPDSLAITEINFGTDVYTNTSFDIEIQLFDTAGIVMVTNDQIDFTVSVYSGTGTLSGNTAGSLLPGNSSVVVSGLYYDTAESGVQLVVADNNTSLAPGISIDFNVIELPPLAKIVFTEIMYNSPESGTDTLEFIELFNNDSVAVDLTGFQFVQGITAIFSGEILQPGDYLVAAYDTFAVNNFYTVSSVKYSGGLGNDGEAVVLVDNFGRIVDSVYYDDNIEWPAGTDGEGASLTLCNPDMDNSLASSWGISLNFVDTVAGIDVFASPGAACTPPTPVRLDFGMINNGADPFVNTPFDVEIFVRDSIGNPAAVSAEVSITLELFSGFGILSGNLSGTLLSGQASTIISGVLYDFPQEFVQIKVLDDSQQLAADTSSMINFLSTNPYPVKLNISSINGGNSPYVDTPFDILVECFDIDGAPANALWDIELQMFTHMGTGNIGGNINGTIPAGQSSTTISGITYDVAEDSVKLICQSTGGVLTRDTSDFFTVIENTSAVLSPGSIAFVQFRSDAPDGFAFVAIQDIPASTVINFTDNGWNESSALTSNEDVLVWTSPAALLSKGSVITWQEGIGVSAGTVAGTLNGFSDMGDQLFAFQGTLASPTVLYGLSTIPWSVSGSVTDQSQSYLPGSLVNGYTAIYFSNADNGYYTATPFSGTPDQVLASVSDTLNWFSANSSGTPFNGPDFWDFAIGIKEVTSHNIVVYPNPAEDRLWVESSAEKFTAVMYDATGKEMLRINSKGSNAMVNMEGFPKGMFLIRVFTAGDIVYTGKVIKY